MRLVLVESPFAYRSADPAERQLGLLRNISYARLALRDCVLRGDAPFASHLLLTQPLVLDDDHPDERQLGIDAGLAWGERADATVLYLDLGLSSGMRYGLERAARAGRPVEERRLAGWERAATEAPRETLLRLGLYGAAELDQVAAGGGVFGPLPDDRGFSALRAPSR